jgi:hypothetical protein
MDYEALRQEYEERRQALRQLQELEANPGWQIVRRAIIEGVRARRELAFGREIQGLDSLITMAAWQAEIRGMNTCLAMPAALIDEAEAELERLRVELNLKEKVDGRDAP